MLDPSVRSIGADCIIELPTENDAAPSAIQEGPTWGIDRIDSRVGLDNQYDDSGITGSGAIVYVLDTGVRITHSEFGGRAEPGAGWVRDGVVTDANTCHWHGTHCASTVGGIELGVAKQVTIVTVQVLSCAGAGSTSGADPRGIEWVVADVQRREAELDAHVPAIISMSLGGGGGGRFDEVINWAYAQGVVSVVAAGNNNADACNYSPASTPLAITVGSTTRTDERSSFSNHGSCVDLFAPGSSVDGACTTSDSCTRAASGTSMACPHVAGVASQVWAAHPYFTPAELAAAIDCLATADVIDDMPADTANRLLYNG
ncbi:hypothetical protein EMIHUDRAFT_71486, partial [Emiliania huxleyi CCMP1516]|uniref:Peptidase S8/S53 domain-containing protein n=3 Tax=Emiliania huxleyi TaxID=2903 RepID=A0A0D3JS62_EMIH1